MVAWLSVLPYTSISFNHKLSLCAQKNWCRVIDFADFFEWYETCDATIFCACADLVTSLGWTCLRAVRLAVITLYELRLVNVGEECDRHACLG